MLAIMEASNKDAQGLASGDCAGVYGARHAGREANGNLGAPPSSAPARSASQPARAAWRASASGMILAMSYVRLRE